MGYVQHKAYGPNASFATHLWISQQIQHRPTYRPNIADLDIDPTKTQGHVGRSNIDPTWRRGMDNILARKIQLRHNKDPCKPTGSTSMQGRKNTETSWKKSWFAQKKSWFHQIVPYLGPRTSNLGPRTSDLRDNLVKPTFFLSKPAFFSKMFLCFSFLAWMLSLLVYMGLCCVSVGSSLPRCCPYLASMLGLCWICHHDSGSWLGLCLCWICYVGPICWSMLDLLRCPQMCSKASVGAIGFMLDVSHVGHIFLFFDFQGGVRLKGLNPGKVRWTPVFFEFGDLGYINNVGFYCKPPQVFHCICYPSK